MSNNYEFCIQQCYNPIQKYAIPHNPHGYRVVVIQTKWDSDIITLAFSSDYLVDSLEEAESLRDGNLDFHDMGIRGQSISMLDLSKAIDVAPDRDMTKGPCNCPACTYYD